MAAYTGRWDRWVSHACAPRSSIIPIRWCTTRGEPLRLDFLAPYLLLTLYCRCETGSKLASSTVQVIGLLCLSNPCYLLCTLLYLHLAERGWKSLSFPVTILVSDSTLGSMPALLVLLGTALVGAVLFCIFYNLFFHPLAKFPGPWYCAISSLPISIISVLRIEPQWLQSLVKKYGSA